jgi:hypothetical protein
LTCHQEVQSSSAQFSYAAHRRDRTSIVPRSSKTVKYEWRPGTWRRPSGGSRRSARIRTNWDYCCHVCKFPWMVREESPASSPRCPCWTDRDNHRRCKHAAVRHPRCGSAGLGFIMAAGMFNDGCQTQTSISVVPVAANQRGAPTTKRLKGG